MKYIFATCRGDEGSGSGSRDTAMNERKDFIGP